MLHAVCALFLSPREDMHTRTVLIRWDFAFVLCGQAADQRVILGKGSVLRARKILHAGVTNCAVHFRELVDLLGLFLYKNKYINTFDTQRVVKCLLHYNCITIVQYLDFHIT